MNSQEEGIRTHSKAKAQVKTERSDGENRRVSNRGRGLTDAEGQDLLKDFVLGNRNAFDRLIAAYSPMIFGVFLRWFRLSAEDAEDLHQEVMLQLLVKSDQISNVRPWVLGTAINQARKRIRKLVRDRKLSEAFLHECEFSTEDGGCENRDLVSRVFAKALPHDRELLHLIYFEGLNYRETADRLGRPLGAIGPLRGRALNRLAGIIDDLEKAKPSPAPPLSLTKKVQQVQCSVH
ncbi:MAG: RNA polymerase sigma factor [Thermoanaerobaculales bacterium]|nr:RNA polymerase sigma factor [Thermoanaerobaculales bacterium]